MSSIGPDGFPEVAEENPSASNGSGDRFLYWPIIVALGWLVALVLTGTVPDPWGFIGLLAILVLWPLSALCACIAALVRVYRREWRRSTSMLILPLITLAAFFNGHHIDIHTAQRLSNDLQLLATRSNYAPAPKQSPDSEPRLQVFPWRDLNGFALYLGYVLLVYDESDEIALPASQRSQAWQARDASGELKCRLSGVEHAFGHYYFVYRRFDC
jgi:hypothetical protein